MLPPQGAAELVQPVYGLLRQAPPSLERESGCVEAWSGWITSHRCGFLQHNLVTTSSVMSKQPSLSPLQCGTGLVSQLINVWDARCRFNLPFFFLLSLYKCEILKNRRFRSLCSLPSPPSLQKREMQPKAGSIKEDGMAIENSNSGGLMCRS